MRPGRPGRRPGRMQAGRRRAAAAVELALILPVLCLIAGITIDYSRLFFDWTTITGCVYNAAYHASQNYPDATQAEIRDAALTDATDYGKDSLHPTPTVSSPSWGPDNDGDGQPDYVDVTVSYTFQAQFPWPTLPQSVALSRKLRMAVKPK